jgi:hypothetical protein
MIDEPSAGAPAPEDGDVNVVTTVIGRDQYRIVATATFETTPAEVWALLWNWERLVAVGLPGLTSDFDWLTRPSLLRVKCGSPPAPRPTCWPEWSGPRLSVSRSTSQVDGGWRTFHGDL